MTRHANHIKSSKALLLLVIVIAAVLAAGYAAGFHPAGGQAGSMPVGRSDPSLPDGPRPYSDAQLGKGVFLVAGTSLSDPWFRETVVLLIGYDATGATGLIINRPTKVPLADVLTNVPALRKRADPLYFGGPVESQRMFMLIRSDQKPEASDTVIPGVHVSTSRKTLERLLDGFKAGRQFRAYSGYAGWLPGQLSREVMRGDWYITDADADTIFEKKESEIWRDLIDRSSSIRVERALGRVAGRAAR